MTATPHGVSAVSRRGMATGKDAEGGHMKCAHEMCGCDAAEGQEYCSDFCKNPTGDMQSGSDCGCGHDACRAGM